MKLEPENFSETPIKETKSYRLIYILKFETKLINSFKKLGTIVILDS